MPTFVQKLILKVVFLAIRRLIFFTRHQREFYKNHRMLVDAWKDLASSGFYPSLWLTLDHQMYPDLVNYIN